MAIHTFDRGGSEDGALVVDIGRFYGEDRIGISTDTGVAFVYLTAGQARAIAHDLIDRADELDAAIEVAQP